MSPLVQLAFVTAALCHDVGHPGENNNFQKTSRSSLAVIYNDKAVLENFHAAETFRILASEQCNFSEAMSPQDFGVFREHVVDLILATDMAVHMEFLSKFKVRLESDDFLQGPELEGDGKGAAEVEKQLKIDTGLLAQACIKAADIGHSAKPWDVHYKYSLSVVEEFFKQGDKEREMGLPISALCDRNAASSLAQSQRGFLLFLCRPMFVVLASAEKVWRERLLDAAIDARRRESQKRRGSTSPKSPKYVKRRSSFDVDLASIGHSSRHLSIVSGLGGNAQVSVVENVCLGLLDKNVEEWTKRMTPPQEKGKK
uniref:PDEase domain-containing protein n=1 Tax=Chromera velia CCMP2878 TaxID=1169474 RepID=A0A0G4I932_9ALVE|eukprot:Cvel_12132.t1-p1 / transcript=Cvel_12132.t1 / gene=Cvel_12132 / organism=Chromera_velia_CCMP2878 / gene_product=Calcium/calmodulin-dependent 3',5'-cyclic, putative / transcript_product=Calcium/calmodulin-dependent 3',5'-cyclic, putative / location=Cvel_scaffold781:65784-67710(-) / protein_length=312 / sequence_SO=supercontig / SO=protein_coding / is_pseudo=false